MNPTARRALGRTSLTVTQMGLGGAPFGNIISVVSDEAVHETMDAAYQNDVRFFDTAPLYGHGRSEERMGAVFARYPRDSFVISTKIGRLLTPTTAIIESEFIDPLKYDPVFAYSREATLRSLESSLKRLQTERIDIVLIHDPDEGTTMRGEDPYAKSHFKEVMDGAYPALAELRAQGVIKAIGAGMNQWPMLADFARAGDFDCFLLAGRYTLLEQEPAHTFLPLCAAKQISIIIGGPYNSGILATGASVPITYYNYKPAPAHLLERTRQIEAVCARHGVALQAAALQFPFSHSAVTSIIPGARSAAEFHANLAFMQQPIPLDFWAELKQLRLIDEAAPIPVNSER